MIALYLLTGTFMVLFFIFLVFFVVYTERKRAEMETVNKERFEKLTEKIEETQALYRNEVTNILASIKKLLK